MSVCAFDFPVSVHSASRVCDVGSRSTWYDAIANKFCVASCHARVRSTLTPQMLPDFKVTLLAIPP